MADMLQLRREAFADWPDKDLLTVNLPADHTALRNRLEVAWHGGWDAASRAAADEIERMRDELEMASGTAEIRIVAIEAISAERDALRQRIERAPVLTATRNGVIRTGVGAFPPGAKVRLVVEDAV